MARRTRVAWLSILLVALSACGSEPKPEPERPTDVSAFYKTVDLEGLQAEFHPRFAEWSTKGARTGNGGKGIGSAGWWFQDFRWSGTLKEGDTPTALRGDVMTRLKAVTKAAGAVAGTPTLEPGTDGESIERLPYTQAGTHGEWMVTTGPGKEQGEMLLIVTMREPQP